MMDPVDEVRLWAKKMVQRESRGNGDQANALERVARLCKIQPRSLRRIINGETIDPGIRVYGNVRKAFLTHTAKMISELQEELRIEKSKASDMDLLSIVKDAEELSKKLKERVEGMKNDRTRT